MQSLETTSGDLETTSKFGTWKWLLWNECGRVARGHSDCWGLQRLLEAATGCRQGPQYNRKCSFYFNCYFSHTTSTNRDLRQKAVYFPPRQQGVVLFYSDINHRPKPYATDPMLIIYPRNFKRGCPPQKKKFIIYLREKHSKQNICIMMF